MQKYLYISLGSVLLILTPLLWYQFRAIEQLKEDNLNQAFTIERQRQANLLLAENLKVERQAVETAQENAKKLKETIGNVQREIRALLDKNACTNTALPAGVSDHIKRLHQQSGEHQN